MLELIILALMAALGEYTGDEFNESAYDEDTFHPDSNGAANRVLLESLVQ